MSLFRIFSFTCRDGSSGLALSTCMYIRKSSFSPSISSQMDFYLHDCDYIIKAVKNGSILTMGKVSN